MRKKQEAEAAKENSAAATNANVLNDKVSVQTTLCAPAVNTGGRDAISLRTSGAAGSPSALDLIKKKLQDSGTPVTQPIPSSSGAVALENTNLRTVETVLKGQQNEINKDKQKDPNGDDNLSDSSESDDEDNGPTKEERIVQFKV